MFVLSKVLGWLASAANLIFLLLAVGTLLLWTRWRRTGRVFVTVAAVILAAGLVLPISDWIASPLEQRFRAASVLPERVDGIIVLAGGTRPDMTAAIGQPSLGESAERIVTFVTLSRRFPDATLVFAGGSGGLRQGSSAAAEVQPLLADLGVDLSRVVFEGKSRTTYESAQALASMIEPGPDETWLLVTSAQHMPRSIGVFRKTGFDLRPYQVDYRVNPRRPPFFRLDLTEELWALESPAHEWAGLVAYWLFGYTSELFPGP